MLSEQIKVNMEKNFLFYVQKKNVTCGSSYKRHLKKYFKNSENYVKEMK